MLDHLLTQTVELAAPEGSGTDDFGETVAAWGPWVPARGRLEVELGDESDGGDRDSSVHTARLFLPATADIGPRHRVRADGIVWEVDGPPARHRTPAASHHVEARLRWVEGA